MQTESRKSASCETTRSVLATYQPDFLLGFAWRAQSPPKVTEIRRGGHSHGEASFCAYGCGTLEVLVDTPTLGMRADSQVAFSRTIANVYSRETPEL